MSFDAEPICKTTFSPGLYEDLLVLTINNLLSETSLSVVEKTVNFCWSFTSKPNLSLLSKTAIYLPESHFLIFFNLISFDFSVSNFSSKTNVPFFQFASLFSSFV